MYPPRAPIAARCVTADYSQTQHNRVCSLPWGPTRPTATNDGWRRSERHGTSRANALVCDSEDRLNENVARPHILERVADREHVDYEPVGGVDSLVDMRV